MAGIPPGMGVGMEDEHRQRFNQHMEGFLTDDGAWTQDRNALGQRINLLMLI